MQVRHERKRGRSQESILATVHFEREKLRLVETPFGVLVELEGTTPAGEPGGPGLPSKVIKVALPPHTEPTQLTAKPLATDRISKKAIMIAPLQHPRAGVRKKPISELKVKQREDPEIFPLRRSLLRPPETPFVEPFDAPPLVPPKIELYDRELEQPRPLARLVAFEHIGLTPVAVVEISPVQINNDRSLDFHSEIEVKVNFRSKDDQVSISKGKELYETPVKTIRSRTQAQRLLELARAQVVNSDLVVDFTKIFPELILSVDYLIITDDQTWDEQSIAPLGSAGDLVAVFQRLADWKAKRGLRSKVVTISAITSGRHGNFTSGARDLQEVIRSFLKWAVDAWGVSWVLLGGDVNILPVRRVAGASEGHIWLQTDDDPPPNNKSFWSGTYLKMKVVNPGVWWPGSSTNHHLVRPDTGLLIPYDPTGTAALGWYFTTDDSYSTRSPVATQYVRVSGTQAQIKATLQFLYQWNSLPTDLYYASLFSPTYNVPGRHDWDLLDNGIYGQHTNDTELDGVSYEPDISVGRAPVASSAQANAFVDKLIAYEQFRMPDGTLLDENWPKKLLLVSSNWGGRFQISSTAASPPTDNRYYHGAGESHTLIKLKDIREDLKWRLIVQVLDTDLRLIPYDRSASGGRGWYYAISDANLSVSERSFTIWGTTIHFPIPTNWIVVYGPTAELTPQRYIFDYTDPDGSMRDQEELRQQLATDFPLIDRISRLYEDEIDLAPAETAAAPLDHLTSDRLRDGLNGAPHFVSLSGHGNSDGCCGLNSAMAQGLTNGYQSFIGYADSCLTNQFDANDAVSEHLLFNPNGGGVGYIGNTRFSWIGVGDNFQRKFFERLKSTQHLGLANDIRGSMVNEWTGFYRLYNKWAIFTLNLMGDPEMPVWLGRPHRMTADLPEIVDKRLPFTVEVKHRVLFFELPLASASVHIQQGDFSRQAFTDATGRVNFDLNPAELGQLDVTVTRSDHIPVIGEARITGPAWVSGHVTAVWHQHVNQNHSLIRLQLDSPIDGDANRGWYANNSHPDYQIILDAATDAYVAAKKISLFVNNTDEGGDIEKFRFGHLVFQLDDRFELDRLVDVERPEINPEVLSNLEPTEGED